MCRQVHPVKVGGVDQLSEGGVGPLLPVRLQTRIQLGTGICRRGAVHVTAGRGCGGGAVGHLVCRRLSDVYTGQGDAQICCSHLQVTTPSVSAMCTLDSRMLRSAATSHHSLVACLRQVQVF